MQPAESEIADLLHWLRPDNPVMSHLDSVIWDRRWVLSQSQSENRKQRIRQSEHSTDVKRIVSHFKCLVSRFWPGNSELKSC